MPIIECWCEHQVSADREGWLLHHADQSHTFVPDCLAGSADSG